MQLTAISQCPCLPEGITFTTQAQIDNFQVNYPGCTEIEGNVRIGYIDNQTDITNFNGLSVVNSIGGYLRIMGNPNLVNMFGLNNLSSIVGNFETSNNETLKNFEGLDNLTIIEGNLEIGIHSDVGTGAIGNSSLLDMSGLNNIISVGGSLLILANDSLLNLTGLENLTSIGMNLEIGYYDFFVNHYYGNPVLTDLTALQSLSSIGGSLLISCCENLTNIEGLENIDPNSIYDLKIQHNDLLSECDVQSICDYLAAPNGTIEIHDNASGCNSQQEVEEACMTFIEKVILNSCFTISPNPIESSAFISFHIQQPSPVAIKISDMSGREIIYHSYNLHKGEQIIPFDTSALNPGIYFCTIKTNEGIQTSKIIKL